MPKYFFNVHDGRSDLDQNGVELPDLAAAKIEGIRFAGVLIHENAACIATNWQWRIEVADETGLVLLRMDFSYVQSPALQHDSTLPSATSTARQ